MRLFRVPSSSLEQSDVRRRSSTTCARSSSAGTKRVRAPPARRARATSRSRCERGECVAILGQNGSGKSTLVRLLSTLLLHDGGSARVFGHDAFKETRAVRRLVNRVSVEASFFKKMSAAENLALRGALLRDDAARDARARSREILERVGFPADRRGEAMEHLSRGMQQKVALARALLTSPVLLLLDEPTTGLDPRSKLEVQDFIREMRALHDSTILLCTHDMDEAEALADRVGILDRGELLFLEPVEDVKERFGVETLEEAFFAATGRTLRGRDRRRQGPGGVRVDGRDQPRTQTVRHELIGLGGVVERNLYLDKRYFCGTSRSCSGRSRTRSRSSSSRAASTCRRRSRTSSRRSS